MIEKIWYKRQQGQTMVEFALVLPVLAILLFGVIQFGVAFNNYLAVTDAVRAGSRQAAVARYLPDSQRVPKVESKVRASADNLNQSKLKVFVSASSNWDPGSDVTVRATYPFSISLLGVVVKSGTLESKTTERVE
ncbi:MAG: TadE/TadG family type IV pilus assembly protein, partial [Gaiellaceae bacterium]